MEVIGSDDARPRWITPHWKRNIAATNNGFGDVQVVIAIVHLMRALGRGAKPAALSGQIVRGARPAALSGLAMTIGRGARLAALSGLAMTIGRGARPAALSGLALTIGRGARPAALSGLALTNGVFI